MLNEDYRNMLHALSDEKVRFLLEYIGRPDPRALLRQIIDKNLA